MDNDTNFDSAVQAVQWLDGRVRLLDQRILPTNVNYIDYDNATELAQAIRDMVVRGAPAIGITAAYAVVLAARKAYQTAKDQWRELIQVELQVLATARPTAVNLRWALETMQASFIEIEGEPEPALLQQAIKIHEEDIAANKRMGELGADIIGRSANILTHCNAGALATGGYGTALGVIRALFARGGIDNVYADETRPWLQGSRLTAWELQQDQVPVTILPDSAASYLFATGKVDWVIVGADRIAANGDVANKIGTYNLAVSAHQHSVKFMVVAPLSTVDPTTESGEQITIEHRPGTEVRSYAGQAIAPEEVAVWNPVFDITPASFIDVIVTEKGAVKGPNTEKITALF